MIYDREDSDSEVEEGSSFFAIPRPRDHPARQQQRSSAPVVKVESYDLGSDSGPELQSHPQRDSLTSFLVSKRRSLDWGERKDSLEGSYQSSRSSTPSSPREPRELSLPREDNAKDEFILVARPAMGRRVSDVASEWDTLGIAQSYDDVSSVSDSELAAVSGSETAKRESFENKQLYLMVARCVAYPFNAKHQLETSPPKLKLNMERFRQVCHVLQLCLDREPEAIRQEVILSHSETKCSRNEKFLNCLQWYIDNVMQRDDVISACHTGGFSIRELDAIFKVLATKHLSYTTPDRQLDSVVLQLWCSTFRKLVEQSSRSLPGSPNSPLSPSSSGTVLSQDRLYRLFQNVLKIRSIEHQVLYRACQLGNVEEQEAVARRELQKRKKLLEGEYSPRTGAKFGNRQMGEIFKEEQLKMVRQLTINLDQLSLSGTGLSFYPHRKKKVPDSGAGSITLTKHDLQLHMKAKVTIHDLTQLATEGKTHAIFCVFEMVDGSDPRRTQTVLPEYGSANFGEAGEFWTNSPLPQIKFTLRQESHGFLSGDKIIGKKVYTAMPTSTEVTDYVDLVRHDKDTTVIAKLKISVFLERPGNMRKCGFLNCAGDYILQQWKRRFFTLMQLSQYKFILCTYQPKDTHPRDNILLEGFTIDYVESAGVLEEAGFDADHQGSLFMLVSEAGRIYFGCRDDLERESWVQWIVRATGQSYQPTITKGGSAEEEKKATGASSGSYDLDRYGLSEVVNIDPATIDANKMFTKLFQKTLKYRLSEDVFSRGLFSPSQMYVMDEFCARYSVRDSFRHLTCLKTWLDFEEQGEPIWPVMLLSSFRFCQMHVGGMHPPERAVIVTEDEQSALIEISHRIEEFITRKITNFRTCFPFGCPKDDLKVTIKLFNLVATINHSGTSDHDNAPMKLLNITMERAALTNYKQVFGQLGVDPDEVTPLSMAKVFELAQYCVEFMYELHDFYWEDFTQVASMFVSHVEAFWSFFLVDIREAMQADSDTVTKLQLFHIINQYFSSQPTMKLGKFHHSFLELFTPVVVQYVEGLEADLRDDLIKSFMTESWMPVSGCCAAVEGALKAMASLKRFSVELAWPEDVFAAHMQKRVLSICTDRFQEAADYTVKQLKGLLSSVSVGMNFRIPPEVFSMLNTLVYLNAHVLEVCASHRAPEPSPSDMSVEEHLSSVLQSAVTIVIDTLCNPLASLLNKLAKYDPSDGIFATLKMLLPTSIPVSGYGNFVTSNLTGVSDHLVSTIFSNFLVNWYECQLHLVNQWLNKRLAFSLRAEQQQIISTLLKAIRESFGSYDLPSEQLESDSYLAIEDRLRIEKSRVDLLSVDKS